MIAISNPMHKTCEFMESIGIDPGVVSRDDGIDWDNSIVNTWMLDGDGKLIVDEHGCVKQKKRKLSDAEMKGLALAYADDIGYSSEFRKWL